MSPELEAQIRARWPGWFYRATADGGAPAPFTFEHGDGWYDLLVRIFERIEAELATRNVELAGHHTHFSVIEVKEKFGALRIIATGTNETLVFAFQHAMELSLTICEVCSAPGMLRTEYCKTLCAICRSEREYGS